MMTPACYHMGNAAVSHAGGLHGQPTSVCAACMHTPMQSVGNTMLVEGLSEVALCMHAPRAGQPICSLADVCDMNREAERISCLRDAVFLKGCIPRWHAVAGYAAFGILAIIVIPFLYHPVKWCASVRFLPPPQKPQAFSSLPHLRNLPRGCGVLEPVWLAYSLSSFILVKANRIYLLKGAEVSDVAAMQQRMPQSGCTAACSGVRTAPARRQMQKGRQEARRVCCANKRMLHMTD